jgi:hypothetical protein
MLLSLCLALFLADAITSIIDDTLVLLFGFHAVSGLRMVAAAFAAGLAFLCYLLLGLTPLVPKRLFLPILLFGPVASLGLIPISIYQYSHLGQAGFLFSLCQLIIGLTVLYRLQRGMKLSWPWLPEERLSGPVFTWRHLIGFVAVNLFVLGPAIALYLAFSLSLAVGHLSGGFLALRSDGLVVRVKQYVRDDGKSVELIPMMHIGETDFYRKVGKMAGTNSVVLLEGVTDEKHLIKQRLSYKRMATALGLSEQQEEFVPKGAHVRHADVDVQEFAPSTLEFINAATLLHSRGLTLSVLRELIATSPSPETLDQLWTDLLQHRNEHLFKVLQAELARSDLVVIPWGAAHMPGIAQEIERAGFRLRGTQEYDVVRFRRRAT